MNVGMHAFPWGVQPETKMNPTFLVHGNAGMSKERFSTIFVHVARQNNFASS